MALAAARTRRWCFLLSCANEKMREKREHRRCLFDHFCFSGKECPKACSESPSKPESRQDTFRPPPPAAMSIRKSAMANHVNGSPNRLMGTKSRAPYPPRAPRLFRPFLNFTRVYTRYELFHEVHGVKHGTAPAFWGKHVLSVKGGFARVGFLSMKSFNSKGVSAPTWGPERKRRSAANA